MTNANDILLTADSIMNTIDAIVNNPVFVKYGLVGLFVNGVLSPVLPFPPELTGSALILAGESKILVVLVLSASWILGGVLWYYAGSSGNKFTKRWLHKYHDKEYKKDKKSRRLLSKYGWAIILVSPWIPILGDFIPIVAGIKKYDSKKYIFAMSAGKIIKAIAIVFLSSWIFTLHFF
ncbi:MAG: VTT domain-containing protein [Thermoproteota archaeon]|jgi:membrane protein YqaA with SNARE-associated domain|nr:VTT domain-containing protein [Thermoproteota archaeon]MDQ3983752.1 VTT domain-containing protein [Thermoproteota archaeon]MDQ4022719.1 VTT domain-containing protein [Thermoproteota archaeon]